MPRVAAVSQGALDPAAHAQAPVVEDDRGDEVLQDVVRQGHPPDQGQQVPQEAHALPAGVEGRDGGEESEGDDGGGAVAGDVAGGVGEAQCPVEGGTRLRTRCP